MDKLEYMNALEAALVSLEENKRLEILADYENHFTEAMGEGKQVSEVIEALGEPETLAGRYVKLVDEIVFNDEIVSEAVSETQKPSQVKQVEPVFVPYERTSRSGFAQAIIIVVLVFINMTFVLGPFIAVWSIWFAMMASGGAFVIESIRMVVFSSMGTYISTGLSGLTIFSQIGFYIAFGLFLILLGLKFGSLLGMITKKYLNWTSRLVKGV